MSDNMNANITGGAGGDTAGGGNDKTFTQAELNQIIGDRLAKERARMEADIAGREQDLAQREFNHAARDIAAKRGFGAELLDVLKASTVEDLDKALDIIEKHGQLPTVRKDFEPGKAPPGQEGPSADGLMRGAFGLKKG